MTRSLLPLLVFATLALIPASARAQNADCATLPANLVVPAVYQDWVEALIARSPTLQRQCLAIARAGHVTVQLQTAWQTSAFCRARTSFTRFRSGRLRAAIAIPVSVDFAELLAHEFEHVVEQIEGLDLRLLALERNSGVHETARNVFETIRARQAGLAAAGEVLTCNPTGGCAGPAVMLASRD